MDGQGFLSLYAGLEDIDGPASFNRWREGLPGALQRLFAGARHGDLPRWHEALAALPSWPAGRVELDRAAVAVRCNTLHDGRARAVLEQTLRAFTPWRKGPYDLHGVSIDSEWRSDLKWERLAPHISPLKGRLVLDAGSGNGYHCWRMHGAGARAVIGIDPTWLYVMQYLAVQHFIRSGSVFVLPCALEALPEQLEAFDTVFSMGVLYHRRSPLDHLRELYACLRPGGELVLETLVVEGDEHRTLVPRGRYARMKNVWFIPSPDMLAIWLERCGFGQVRCVDVCTTTTEEQRVTGWSGSASLADFLDPDDPAKTVEGHPAPRRALLIARR